MNDNLKLMTRFSVANADYSKTRIADMYELEIYRSIERTTTKLRIEITEVEEFSNKYPNRKYDMVTEELPVPTVGHKSKLTFTLNGIKVLMFLTTNQPDVASAVVNPIHIEFNIIPVGNKKK